MASTSSISLEQALIAAVERFPCLYDKNDKFHKDIRVKDAAWKQIAAIIKTSPSNCKRIWMIQRDCLRRVLKKRARNLDESSKRPWKYEEEMSFLLPFLRTRPITRLSASEDEDEDSMQPPEAFSTPAPSAPAAVAAAAASEPAAVVVEESTSVRPPLPLYRPRPVSATTGRLLHEDIDAFFRSMAATVKTFPPRQRILAKSRIFSLVSKLELQLCLSELEHNPLEGVHSPASHRSWQDVKLELEDADEQMIMYD